MTASNYSHQLRQQQVKDLEEMSAEASTLSDLAYTILFALNEEYGSTTIGRTQSDLADRLQEVSEKLQVFTEERSAEVEGFLELGVAHG